MIKHIKIFFVIGIIIFFLYFFNIGCPIRYFIGYPCPTCGITRSILCLLRLDFKGFIYYNPMTVIIILAFILAIHRKIIPINKKLVDVLVCIMALLIFIVYIIRFNNIP